ncbi:MAG: hypothetical protein KDD70_07930 [Bdellovibrionales bacterium]|nr:hypothetical protein [Bdellovibrionales bacterium]
MTLGFGQGPGREREYVELVGHNEAPLAEGDFGVLRSGNRSVVKIHRDVIDALRTLGIEGPIDPFVAYQAFLDNPAVIAKALGWTHERAVRGATIGYEDEMLRLSPGKVSSMRAERDSELLNTYQLIPVDETSQSLVLDVKEKTFTIKADAYSKLGRFLGETPSVFDLLESLRFQRDIVASLLGTSQEQVQQGYTSICKVLHETFPDFVEQLHSSAIQ